MSSAPAPAPAARRPAPIAATVHTLMREIEADPTRPLRLTDLALDL